MLAVDDAVAVLAVSMLAAQNVTEHQHQHNQGYENDCKNHKRIKVNGLVGLLGRADDVERQDSPLVRVDNQRNAQAAHAESLHGDVEAIGVGGVGELEAKIGYVLLVRDVLEGPLQQVVENFAVGIMRRLPMKNDSIVGDDVGLLDGSRNCVREF